MKLRVTFVYHVESEDFSPSVQSKYEGRWQDLYSMSLCDAVIDDLAHEKPFDYSVTVQPVTEPST